MIGVLLKEVGEVFSNLKNVGFILKAVCSTALHHIPVLGQDDVERLVLG
jgi:hypothetical protein